MYSPLEIKSKIKTYSVIFRNQVDFNQEYLKIVDKNVAYNFPNLVDENSLIISTDENLKSWDGLTNILNWLLTRNANIQTQILVIGGGVLQDAVGFCASIYARGIDYTLVPTTLLSQIDSCVGGKTSVNFGSRKNILGTFYPPKEIIICPKFLKTLPQEDFCSGLGELLKFDILRDRLLQSKVKDLIYFKDDILRHIHESLKYKISILEIDEFDKKERKLLNFGHTFGHALEITSEYKLSHGYAVAIGCMIALNISNRIFEDCNNLDDAKKITSTLLDQTIKLDKKWFDYNKLMECVKSDKKNTGQINMVLIKDRKPILQKIENFSIIKEELENIYEAFRLCGKISS